MNAQVGYLMGLAMEYIQKGSLGDAERLLNQSLKMMPKNSDAYRLLGIVSVFKKERNDALKMFDQSIKIDPKNWLAHSNRGNVLKDLRRHEEALISYDNAIKLQPNYAEAYNNKACLLQDLKQFEMAIKFYEKAISLQPNYAEAYGNMGNALLNLNILDKAMMSYQKAVELGSEDSLNLGALIHCKMKLCDWSEIDELFKKVSTKIVNGSNKIHPYHLLPFLDDPLLIKNYTHDYVSDEFFSNSELSTFHEKHEKIRIGYFSADFRNHAVSFLIVGMLEAHNRDKFELIGFSTYVGQSDEMTSRVIGTFDKFFDVSMHSDRAIAELSRELGIDIAVDLGGLTRDSRLGIFSFRPAPIQISYIGYLGTLATPYIDYIIADKTIIPVELQEGYSEKIIYLPSYQANDPQKYISERVFIREELGIPKDGFVYCCFNSNYKFTPSIFNSWARILGQVEGSVLLLYAESDAVKINLSREIELRGIDSSRLIFAGKICIEDYLARYRVADLFLDTSPYNAGATASDALWAGLPVITFLGKSFSARMCGSLLNSIGLPELVTASQREYEELAIEIGKNSDLILALKNKLAENRLSKPLFDVNLFTQNLELAYTKAYTRARLMLPPEHIY